MATVRRLGTVAELNTQKRRNADRWRPPTQDRAIRGPSADYLAPPGGPSWVIQPFEVALRFPAHPFNYGGEVTLAQGAALTLTAFFVVPINTLGVFRELVIYSTLPAGIADLTQLELEQNQEPARGRLVFGQGPAAALIPDAAFEEPVLTFNVQLRSEDRLELRLGRVGAVDPTAYTYRARLKGTFWPKHKRRGW